VPTPCHFRLIFQLFQSFPPPFADLNLDQASVRCKFFFSGPAFPFGLFDLFFAPPLTPCPWTRTCPCVAFLKFFPMTRLRLTLHPYLDRSSRVCRIFFPKRFYLVVRPFSPLPRLEQTLGRSFVAKSLKPRHLTPLYLAPMPLARSPPRLFYSPFATTHNQTGISSSHPPPCSVFISLNSPDVNRSVPPCLPFFFPFDSKVSGRPHSFHVCSFA